MLFSLFFFAVLLILYRNRFERLVTNVSENEADDARVYVIYNFPKEFVKGGGGEINVRVS